MQPLTLPPPPLAREYRTLYVDFPWPERGGGRIKRGADRHYPLMGQRALTQHARVFADWAAPNAHLYLWVTNNYLLVAGRLIKQMRFRYVTAITWVKDKQGIGQYYRGRTEHCLFCVRGRLPYRVQENGLRAQGQTVIYSPPDLPDAIEAPRREHSRKPEAFRQAIELVSPGPYLEIFARRRYPRWDSWGNQIAPVSCPTCGTPSDDLPCEVCAPVLRAVALA